MKPTDWLLSLLTPREIYLVRHDIKPEISEFEMQKNQNREKSKVMRRISVTIDGSAVC